MKKVLFALLFIAPLLISAQEDQPISRQEVRKYPKVKWQKKLKLADQLAKQGSYYNACEYYEDVLKEKPDKVNVMHQLAELNRSLRDYKVAEKYYTLEMEKAPKDYPNDRYYLAMMQKMNGKAEEAKKTFQQYLKSDLGKDLKSYKSLAKIEMIGCDSTAAWMANPNKAKVEHEEGFINNVLSDFAPKPLPNGDLLYSSLKSDTAINITSSKGDYYSKIYLAKKNGKVWADSKLPYPPNESKTHVGNAILSEDEKTMYFTKCDQTEIVRMKCRIFKTEKEGAEWSNSVEVKELNSPTGTTTQPTFGLDKDGNKVMYFVSDRGGKGGLDIFYSPISDKGAFGPVKNVGSEINTPADEMTPTYDFKSKTLYFSSNGHPSLGGLDIYRIAGAPDAWDVPFNMGAPLNSTADDLYFTYDNSGKKGYLVSNRVGSKTIKGETCSDDIWSLSFNSDVILKGSFAYRNDPAKTPISGVDASMYSVNGKTFDFMGNTVTTGTPFTYLVKRGTSYKINGNKEGHWPSVENVVVSETEERDTISQIFYIDKIDKKRVKIENIYFAFDQSNVVEFYKLKMDSVISIMKQNPGYSLEVQGHTDNKGTDEYNEKLSQRRAEEAKGYIVSKGIATERVVAKGYGESQPMANNEKDGQDDPEGRAQNRRVVFKILPDKPEDAPEIEYIPNAPIPETKTGPGFNKK